MAVKKDKNLDFEEVVLELEKKAKVAESLDKVKNLISETPSNKFRRVKVVLSLKGYDYEKDGRRVSGLTFTFLDPVLEKEQEKLSAGYTVSTFTLQTTDPGDIVTNLSSYGFPMLVIVEFRLPKDRKSSMVLTSVVPVAKIVETMG